MEKRAIVAADAPAAIGPYSQGITVGKAAGGRLVFVSGQTPLDPATGKLVEGGVAEQAQRCLQNISAVLKAAHTSSDRVVKTTVFLVDMADFKAMNEVYAAFFGSVPPARSTIAVAGLPMGARVEIEAIAISD